METKDPAVLLYVADFLVGTQFFSDEQLGVYMRLLLAQHQHGHLSQNQFDFIAKKHDVEIVKKFKRDENNLLFNQRMEDEIQRRKEYALTRSKNRKGKTKKKTKITHDNHVKIISSTHEHHIEDKDITKNKKETYASNKEKNVISSLSEQEKKAKEHLETAKEWIAPRRPIEEIIQIYESTETGKMFLDDAEIKRYEEYKRLPF